MKKALFILILISLTHIALGRTWELCLSCPESNLNALVARVANKDTILILKGEYRGGPYFIDKPITVLGKDYPVFRGSGDHEIFVLQAPGIIMEGIQIENVRPNYLKDLAAIRVEKVQDVELRNLRIIKCFFGIYLEHCGGGIIENNFISGDASDEASSGNAIHAWYCKNLTIRKNDLSNHRDGIYFEFVDSSRISHNVSYNNLRYGLHFMFSNDDAYQHNQFKRNGAGVAVMFSKRILMHSNLFEQNWGSASYGLLLKEIYDGDIRENVFRENSIAIHVEGSSRIQYLHNQFVRNGWAIRMTGGCMTNEITRNNFFSNTMDMLMHGRMNDNSFDQNYWSSYTGYDMDRDGIGDVPYRPVKLFAYLM
ncbi:MAG: nitrous oxide reductase family maturation protein NosD, partial [Saprospiraceae bacterium]|nr:nitrous oxide reductase family maturation protein NosD [Saprospiraceae bacterium]